jgi:hypothetical protein
MVSIYERIKSLRAWVMPVGVDSTVVRCRELRFFQGLNLH